MTKRRQRAARLDPYTAWGLLALRAVETHPEMRGASMLGFSKQWAAMLSSGLAPFHEQATRDARRARRR